MMIVVVVIVGLKYAVTVIALKMGSGSGFENNGMDVHVYTATGKVGVGKTFTLPGERKLVINPTYDHATRAVDVEVQQVSSPRSI